MKSFGNLLFIVSFFLFGYNGFTQEKVLWTQVDSDVSSGYVRSSTSYIEKSKQFLVDSNQLNHQLNKNTNTSKTIQFPNAEGKMMHFVLRKSTLLHPDLAVKFPKIKTYLGKANGKDGASIYLVETLQGIYAMIFSTKTGVTYIDPIQDENASHIIYKKEHLISTKKLECLVTDTLVSNAKQKTRKSTTDLKMRTFRLALATTEEYSNFHINAAGLDANSTRQDSINSVLSAITVTLSRVIPIFERDVALTMQLVANNDQLIFLESDPGQDPYTNNSGPTMLSQNQTTIDAVIGASNYDIGHVFSTGGGGVAFPESPCGPSKAGGVTGSSNPMGDGFDVDLVSHEMGHQFGAHHTFNGDASFCGTNNNRNDDTAVEPGSGSTIMAYAGICSPQNLQNNSDPYFHAISIQEMFTFISTTANCDIESDFISNLHAPIANAGSGFVIPKSTPFKLKGAGFDADGDQLSYCWEQIDSGVSDIQIPPSSFQEGGAVFRSLPGTDYPDRYLPKLSSVVAGNAATWEVLPSVSRSLNFALTVRDNALEEGQAAIDEMTVFVNDNAGPFTVSTQSVDGIVWTPGQTETISWNVAGTNLNGINVSRVNILLSVDGGLTFTETLAANTPNDGFEQIVVPDISSPNVRLMIESIGNIFYAVNNRPFSIGTFETICAFYDSTNIPLEIPDNNSTGITSVISILDDFAITDLNISVDITHSYLSDLQLFLKAPNGTEILVYDRNCGSSGIQRQNIDAVFDDGANSFVCFNTVPAISGITKSIQNMSLFNGLSSFGDWTLKVVDNAPADVGVLNNWSIELCQTNQTASLDDFSFKEFQVYPNPFHQTFTVVFESVSTDEVQIELNDIRGRKLYHQKFDFSDFSFKKELDYSYLAPGVYFLRVRRGGAEAIKKIIKN